MDHKNTAALLFSCEDRVGIIAKLSAFFAERSLNILRYEEFVDAGVFFSRLKWALDDRWNSSDDFIREFNSVAEYFDAKFSVHFFDNIQNIGLFVSKQPHALVEILTKHEAGFFPNVALSFVISNSKASKNLADRYGIPFFYTKTRNRTDNYESDQLKIINQFKPDCIALARYMKVLSPNFLNEVDCPIVNIHHSFLPSFVGARPYHMAYERGVKLIGATSHYVTEELDQGPIIEQDVMRIGSAMSVDETMKLGQDIEAKVFSKALQKVLEHKTIVYKNRTIVFN